MLNGEIMREIKGSGLSVGCFGKEMCEWGLWRIAWVW